MGPGVRTLRQDEVTDREIVANRINRVIVKLDSAGANNNTGTLTYTRHFYFEL